MQKGMHDHINEGHVEHELCVSNNTYDRSIQSVIQADDEIPGCEVYRQRLIDEFRDTVFSPLKYDPEAWKVRGPREISKVKLTLIEGAVPRSSKAIRAVGIRETLLYEKIQTFLDRGYIVKSNDNTDWVTRAFLVPKPNGKWRLVIDYRYVNTQLKGQNFPLPVIKDQLANQHGNFLWTLVDLEDGFHQMHLEEESMHITSFITPFGVYMWRVLPMGIKVAPQVYQRMVDWVVRKCKCSRPYIDDILTGTGKGIIGRHGQIKSAQDFLRIVKSEDPGDRKLLGDILEEHYQAVRRLFLAFQEARLTIKPEKCHFFRTTVQYIGHVLRAGMRFPNPDKTAAIREWKEEHITTPKQLKGFLGLANWYALYIKDFAKHATPLMEALRGKYQYEPVGKGQLSVQGLPPKRKRIKLSPKETRIHWTSAMREGFQNIKQSLIQAVELYIPSPTGRWKIHCDACTYAVGGELSQEGPDGQWHPVAFFSRKLQGAVSGGKGEKGESGQMAWTIREKETYALVWCLLKFQSWIGGNEIEVHIDHSSILQWYKEDLCTISGPLGRRGRWHEFLSRFNLTIFYKQGEQNEAADALSRWAYPAGLAQDTNFHGSDADLEG